MVYVNTKNITLISFYILFLIFSIIYIKFFFFFANKYFSRFRNKLFLYISVFVLTVMAIIIWVASFAFINPLFNPITYLLISYFSLFISLSITLSIVYIYQKNRNIFIIPSILLISLLFLFKILDVLLASLFCLSS